MDLDGEKEATFTVVDCAHCGGVLKPTVVFFGDSLLPAVAAEARRLAEEADAMLVVGSSLSTWRCDSRLR
jgi:NAD-dependent SIR2 family protein deacetylase